MIRGETPRLSSPPGLAGQAACLSPGGAVSARSPRVPQRGGDPEPGEGDLPRRGGPRCTCKGCEGAQGVGRREGSRSPPLGGCGCWAQVRQGFPASQVPGLSATRAAQSHVSPPCPSEGFTSPKGVGFQVSFFHPKSQKQFRWFHLWFHLLQQRGPVQYRGGPRASRGSQASLAPVA